MKKITLLAFGLLALHASFAQPRNFPKPQSHVLFNIDNPIGFVERGIEFYIFPNGEFDFNTEPSATSDEYYRPRFQNDSGFSDPGIRIEHDTKGRVRRVGNVFINYDMYDRVKRIGTVYLAYHRSSLVQIGGLRLKYNNRGQLIGTMGSVKNQMQQYAYHGQNNFYQSWNNGTVNENNNYYRTENEPFINKKE